MQLVPFATRVQQQRPHGLDPVPWMRPLIVCLNVTATPECSEDPSPLTFISVFIVNWK